MVAPKSKRSKKKPCIGCGAEMKLGSHSCPLCGSVIEATTGDDVETYQSDLRRLREQLQELRVEGREAS